MELTKAVTITITMISGSIGIALPVIPVLNEFVKVLDLVQAQGGISLNSQPRRDVHTSLQLEQD